MALEEKSEIYQYTVPTDLMDVKKKWIGKI